MADDFNIITDQDKKHISYGMCVVGTMAVGTTLGSMAGGQTLLGAVGGTVWGLFNCKYVAEPLKRKLFSQHTRLSDQEFAQVLRAARQQFPHASKAQLLDLIASARLEAKRQPGKYQC